MRGWIVALSQAQRHGMTSRLACKTASATVVPRCPHNIGLLVRAHLGSEHAVERASLGRRVACAEDAPDLVLEAHERHGDHCKPAVGMTGQRACGAALGVVQLTPALLCAVARRAHAANARTCASERVNGLVTRRWGR